MSWPPVIGPSWSSPSRAAAVALTPESAIGHTLSSFPATVQDFGKSTVNCRGGTVDLGPPERLRQTGVGRHRVADMGSGVRVDRLRRRPLRGRRGLGVAIPTTGTATGTA